jgi:hypothetical protein
MFGELRMLLSKWKLRKGYAGETIRWIAEAYRLHIAVDGDIDNFVDKLLKIRFGDSDESARGDFFKYFDEWSADKDEIGISLLQIAKVVLYMEGKMPRKDYEFDDVVSVMDEELIKMGVNLGDVLTYRPNR